MTTVNASVTIVPRKIFVEDSDGRVKVTPDDLNDLGNPLVSCSFLESAVIRYPVMVVVDGTNKCTISIQMYLSSGTVSGRHRLNAWLTDSDITLGDTGTMPSITAKRIFSLITATDGTVSLDIEHVGSKTWYLVVEYAGQLYISDALVFTLDS